MPVGFPGKTIFCHDPTSLLRLVVALKIGQGFVYPTGVSSTILDNGLVSGAANPAATILDLAVSMLFVPEPFIELGEEVSAPNPPIWKTLCKQ